MKDLDPAEWLEIGGYYTGTIPGVQMGMRQMNEMAREFIRKYGRYEDNKNTDSTGLGGRCDHCGAYHHEGSIFQHTNGTVIQVGHTCARTVFGYDSQASLRLARLKRAAKKEGERLRIIFRGYRTIMSAEREQKGVIAWLRSPKDAFAMSLRASAFSKWGWSDKQYAAALKCAKTRIDRAAERAAKEGPKGDAPVGKQTVRGVVLMVKDYESAYGTQTRMLVKTENNARVFCTVPAKILDVTKVGVAVEIKATWKPKPDDMSFAFGSRPSGKVITEPTPQETT